MNRLITDGVTVTHPQLGPGRVVKMDAPYVHVYFPDASTNPHELKKLRMDRCVLTHTPELENDLRLVWRPRPAPRGKRNGTERTTPCVPFAHMVASFRRRHPGGFSHEGLIDAELRYKNAATSRFDEVFGHGRGRLLLDAKAEDAVAKGLRDLYHATNLLSRFELIAMNDGLKDLPKASELLDAVLKFVEAPAQDSFTLLAEAVDALPAKRDGARVLSWPAVTLLPFLANPSRFLMLKPKMTQVVANSYGFDLMYDSRPNWTTYERVQEFGRLLLDNLKAEGARDFIDVHSFIWVVAGEPAMTQG